MGNLLDCLPLFQTDDISTTHTCCLVSEERPSIIVIHHPNKNVNRNLVRKEKRRNVETRLPPGEKRPGPVPVRDSNEELKKRLLLMKEKQIRARLKATQWDLSLILTLSRVCSTFPWQGLELNPSCRYEELLPIDRRFQTTQKLFQETSKNQGFKLLKIECCQNPTMYAMFLMRKAEMESRYGHVTTKFLFHSTKTCNAKPICENNFNWRLHGSSTGSLYGKGVSFSPYATYASHYCDPGNGTKIMFLCEVLESEECFGNADMVLPNVYNIRKQLRYDTAVKNDGRRSVVVKFSDDEFYPLYKIYFKGNPKEKWFGAS